MDSGLTKLIAVAIIAAIFTAGAMSVFGDSGSSESEAEITITGSTTLQPIITAFKEQYEAETNGVTLTITGGGSGHGVSSAGQGTADIGMASRDVKQSELEDYPELETHVIARDGVAIIVGDNAGVTDLTLAQVESIFNGTVTNWNEIGGNNGEIVIFNRDASSGTRDCFESAVMSNSDIVDSANIVASNGAMRTSVIDNPNGIGYISIGYINEETNALNISGVAPTVENVADGSYAVNRNLNLITNGDPEGWTAAFLEWCVQPTAQGIVSDQGFVPLA